jgi:hypothetical protein
MQITLTRVEYLIESAVQDHAAWAEIGELIEQRRRLTESEHKRLVSLQQMLSTEEALLLVRRLADTVTQHVTDKRVLSAILVDLQQFIGPPHALPAYAEDTDA